MKTHVKAPATTANLGPAFDTLGLTLNLWNEAVFSPTDDHKISITIKGEGKDILPQNEDNAIAKAALKIYELVGKSCEGLRIDCINRIPLGSGLGSSSAAMLTGMLGANGGLGFPLSNEEILKLAIEIEGHPDNGAPALLGGLVLSVKDEKETLSVRLPFKENNTPIHATVVLPLFDFPTKEARSVLPLKVARADAIYNISHAILLAEALQAGNLALLEIAMQDTLHQPYRLPLIAGAMDALEAGKKAGAAAVALSGAGPSLIAFSEKKGQAIGAAMKQAFASAGLDARLSELGLSYEGAKVRIIDGN